MALTTRRTGPMHLPVSPDVDRHVIIDTPAVMTSKEWDRMLAILGLFRPGLVFDDPDPGDTYSI